MNIEFKHTKIMKKNWLYIVCFACMATACSGTPQTVNENYVPLMWQVPWKILQN